MLRNVKNVLVDQLQVSLYVSLIMRAQIRSSGDRRSIKTVLLVFQSTGPACGLRVQLQHVSRRLRPRKEKAVIGTARPDARA